MKKNLNIRFAKASDKAAVLELLNAIFADQQRSENQRGEHLWYWKFENNIFGPATIIIAEIQERLVATSTLWPWEFLLRGRCLKALQACDTVVHPDFQGRGLFKKLNEERLKYAKEQQVDFIFNFPNANSLPGYQAMGWEYLGKIKWQVRLLKPWIIVKEMVGNNQAKVLEVEKGFKISPEYCESIVDKKRVFNGKIKINRKLGFFKWRYEDHPSRNYGMIRFEKGRNKSAAIFSLTQRGNSIEMMIMDLIGSNSNTVALFKAIISFAKRNNVSYIVVISNDIFDTQQLWKLGFFNRSIKNLTVMPLDVSLESKLCHFANWDLVASLHDSV